MREAFFSACKILWRERRLELGKLELKNLEMRSLLGLKEKTPLSAKQALLPYLLAPSSVENHADYIKVGGQYNRIIAAVGIPRIVRAGFLNSIMMHQGELDVSMHISPQPVEETIARLNHELIKMSADIYSVESKGGIVPPSLRMKLDDTMRVLQLLQGGEEKLFDYSLYVNVRAESLEKLDSLTSKVLATLGQLGLLCKITSLQMHDALPSVLPRAENRLGLTRNMTSSALAACFPFTSSNLQVMENGVVLGVNDLTGIPLVIDLFSLQNSNALVLGGSGSGKSFSVKTMLLRLRRAGVKIFIVDPQGEYVKLAKKFGAGAQVVDFSPEGKNSINPFDMLGLRLSEKTHALMSLFTVICGELSPAQRSLLDEAVYAIYEQRGVSDFAQTKDAPTFRDLYAFLKEKADSPREHALSRSTALALVNRIKPFASGSLRCFCAQTSVDLKADFIVFDVSYFIDKMQSVAPPAMFITLDFLLNRMKQDPRERKAIVVDEAWRMLRGPSISEYLLLFAKTARKYNASLQIITQELGDLGKSEAGAAVLANTAVKLLLRQDASEIEAVGSALRLNVSEKNRLLVAEPGHGVLLIGNSRIPFYSIFMPEEESFITTRPEASLQQEFSELHSQKLVEKSFEKLDFANGFYRRSELVPEELMLLLKNGFTIVTAYDIRLKRPIDFVVKRVPPESPYHTVYVRQVEQLLREFTDNVKIAATGDVDISFVDKAGKKIGFEIETGTRSDFASRQDAKHLLQYDELYYLVASIQLVEKYQKIGKVITRSQVERFVEERFA